MLEKIATKRTNIIKIRKGQFFRHNLKVGVENLTLTGYSEGKTRLGKQRVISLMRFCKRMTEQGVERE